MKTIFGKPQGLFISVGVLVIASLISGLIWNFIVAASILLIGLGLSFIFSGFKKKMKN